MAKNRAMHECISGKRQFQMTTVINREWAANEGKERFPLIPKNYISVTSMHLSGQTSTQLMQPTHSPA